MVTAAPFPVEPGAVGDAKAYLRVSGTDEDPVIARLIAAAGELCEQFTGQMLLTRSVEEILPASGAWQRLERGPVRAVTSAGLQGSGGAPTQPLPIESYAIDIDASADGWIRVTQPGTARVRVSYEAGIATLWSGLPDGLRQGVLRLAAHLYTQRDEGSEGAPPAVVGALWLPYRRIRIGRTVPPPAARLP